ncbi:MAG: hypothetical protein OXH68_19445 [Gammaproteobacteria bacterium]|nr:hypothetical protein [Gammaproteobacteria bacterium]
MRRWISVCAAAGLCAGCATVKEPIGPADGTGPGVEVGADSAPVPAAGVDAALSVGVVAEPPSGTRAGAETVAGAVPVPSGAEWLSEALEAEYAGVSASVALRQVTRGRPLNLDVGGRDPQVGSLPGAVTVQDHVTSICAQADWACNAVGGVLVVSDMETKTLQVAVQPGSSSASLKLRALATGEEEGSAGDGEDETGVEVKLTPFGEEVAALVETVLGIGGEEDTVKDADEGKPLVDPRTGVVVLPSANAVLVTARPHMMRTVERELERFNAGATRTVRLHVTVYEVSSRDASERGVDLLALRDAAVGFGLRVSGGTTMGGGAVAEVDFLEGNRAHGSRAVLRWLESAGTARLSLNEVLEVRNNQVASVDATETRQFVAKVSQGPRALGGSFEIGPPEITFDELRLGWAVALQPTIIDDQVTVRVALSRRSLIEERPYRFGGGAIEGMNFVTDDLNRLMSVTLRSGETKLLTSWANATSRRMEERVPFLGWFGRGGTREEREHDVVLLMGAEVL